MLNDRELCINANKCVYERETTKWRCTEQREEKCWEKESEFS